ncbi:MAG: hypothetical protein A2Y56_04685 [Candidatus Aminicenantes bacterium RBG_13_63_10]|nr:MAG: hypothetical protein A2Y56_04685 [Candidatus Aminicenantes bacterium RBG_13_63_10]
MEVNMNRRDFVGKAGCGLATFLAAAGLPAGAGAAGQTTSPEKPVALPPRKFYRIDLEVFEARLDSWCHKKGDTFRYPDDWGKVCPWLRGSLNDFIRILESGGTLSWRYEGTSYEKVIDPDGVTTEYVRCPDPTSNLVVKIIRTRVEPPKK